MIRYVHCVEIGRQGRMSNGNGVVERQWQSSGNFSRFTSSLAVVQLMESRRTGFSPSGPRSDLGELELISLILTA